MLGNLDFYRCSEPYCGQQGIVIREESWPNNAENMSFSEVRVEFDYDPDNAKFKAICICRDESNPNQNIFNVRTPVIRTEKRAWEVAKGLLGNLAQNPEEVLDKKLGSRPRETIIDFDLPKAEVSAKLEALGQKLLRSSLRENK
jgi:hypothetical protein